MGFMGPMRVRWANLILLYQVTRSARWGEDWGPPSDWAECVHRGHTQGRGFLPGWCGCSRLREQTSVLKGLACVTQEVGRLEVTKAGKE